MEQFKAELKAEFKSVFLKKLAAAEIAKQLVAISKK